jgi:hypothetical protein
MCLTPRVEESVPYNNNKFRWKVVYIEKNRRGKLCCSGLYTGKKYDKLNKWMKATRDPSYHKASHNIGFHVFITKKDAQDRCNRDTSVVVKVEVDKLVASGTFDSTRSETWKRMRIVEILANAKINARLIREQRLVWNLW